MESYKQRNPRKRKVTKYGYKKSKGYQNLISFKKRKLENNDLAESTSVKLEMNTDFVGTSAEVSFGMDIKDEFHPELIYEKTTGWTIKKLF